MEISPKQQKEMQAEFDRGVAVLKKHLKGLSKNDLVRLSIGQIIEIEDLKHALKYYYEKYGDQEKAEEEKKNA